MNSQKASNQNVTECLPNNETESKLNQSGPQNFCYKYTLHMRNPPKKMKENSARVNNNTVQKGLRLVKILVNANPSEQKQMLGDKLFPLI